MPIDLAGSHDTMDLGPFLLKANRSPGHVLRGPNPGDVCSRRSRIRGQPVIGSLVASGTFFLGIAACESDREKTKNREDERIHGNRYIASAVENNKWNEGAPSGREPVVERCGFFPPEGIFNRERDVVFGVSDGL